MIESKPKNPLVELELHVKNFPTTAPYKIDPREFADSYIEEIKKWHHELVVKTQELSLLQEKERSLRKLENWLKEHKNSTAKTAEAFGSGGDACTYHGESIAYGKSLTKLKELLGAGSSKGKGENKP